MTVQTKHPSNNRTISQSVAVVGKNGLIVDTIATVDASNLVICGTSSLVSYVSPTVTVACAINLALITSHVSTELGVFVFLDDDGTKFFIDTTTVNNVCKTFDVFDCPSFSCSPSTVVLCAGWQIAEGKLINRLMTTGGVSVQCVSLNGVDLSFQLSGKGGSGDSVSIVDKDGDQVEIVDGALEVTDISTIITARHDFIGFTKVGACCNGAGCIATAVYRTGGSAGTIVSTLTFAYDACDDVTSITKT